MVTWPRQYDIEEPQVLKLRERVQLVDTSRRESGLTIEALWMRCISLGEMHTVLELEAFLFGALRPTREEYNVIAIAMNEFFMEARVDHYIPYIEH